VLHTLRSPLGTEIAIEAFPHFVAGSKEDAERLATLTFRGWAELQIECVE